VAEGEQEGAFPTVTFSPAATQSDQHSQVEVLHPHDLSSSVSGSSTSSSSNNETKYAANIGQTATANKRHRFSSPSTATAGEVHDRSSDFASRLPEEYLKYLQPPQRPSSSDWLRTILTAHKSRVLWRIRHPLLTITAVAFLCSVAHCVFGFPGLQTLAAHTLLGSGLSLLLVFRTNSAYQRFQEGRKIWNDILDLCRDIALTMALFRKEAGRKRLRIIRTSVQAFPFAMQAHVKSQESMHVQSRLQWLLEEVDQARLELSGRAGKAGSERKAAGPMSRNRPLHIIARLLKVISSIGNQGESFTNRERVWILSMVTQLSHTVGRCERLVQTPVPLSYARHTSRFVSAWTLTLPLALVPSLRWLTAPVVFLVTWALFGILEIGNLIEDPFRYSIELTPICEAIYHDTARALSEETATGWIEADLQRAELNLRLEDRQSASQAREVRVAC